MEPPRKWVPNFFWDGYRWGPLRWGLRSPPRFGMECQLAGTQEQPAMRLALSWRRVAHSPGSVCRGLGWLAQLSRDKVKQMVASHPGVYRRYNLGTEGSINSRPPYVLTDHPLARQRKNDVKRHPDAGGGPRPLRASAASSPNSTSRPQYRYEISMSRVGNCPNKTAMQPQP